MAQSGIQPSPSRGSFAQGPIDIAKHHLAGSRVDKMLHPLQGLVRCIAKIDGNEDLQRLFTPRPSLEWCRAANHQCGNRTKLGRAFGDAPEKPLSWDDGPTDETISSRASDRIARSASACSGAPESMCSSTLTPSEPRCTASLWRRSLVDAASVSRTSPGNRLAHGVVEHMGNSQRFVPATGQSGGRDTRSSGIF